METRNVTETPPKQRKYVSARDKRSSAVVVVFRYKAECGEYNSFRSLRALLQLLIARVFIHPRTFLFPSFCLFAVVDD